MCYAICDGFKNSKHSINEIKKIMMVFGATAQAQVKDTKIFLTNMVTVSITSNQWVQGSLSFLLTNFPGNFPKARHWESNH